MMVQLPMAKRRPLPMRCVDFKGVFKMPKVRPGTDLSSIRFQWQTSGEGNCSWHCFAAMGSSLIDIPVNDTQRSWLAFPSA